VILAEGEIMKIPKKFFPIFLLGITSFITDLSSEMMMPLIPLFIVSLGGGGLVVGLAGGMGDSVASLLKVFSGYISDRVGKKKWLVMCGYTLSAFAKLIFPFAHSGYDVVGARVLERVGKGIRTAPRDALVAGYTEEGERGKGFGIHRAMDTLGAVMGSFLAFVFLWVFLMDMRDVFLIGAIISFFSIIPLYFVKEIKTEKIKSKLFEGVAGLSAELKKFILVASIFALGNFSYMFFILRASIEFEDGIATVVLLYILFNISYAIFCVPAGSLSDRIGRRNSLLVGYIAFAITCLLFSLSISKLSLIPLFAMYGLSFAFIETVERAFASDLCRRFERGTGLGAFHTSVGLCAFPASMIAGFLWEYSSYHATFLWGAGCSIVASLLLVSLVRE